MAGAETYTKKRGDTLFKNSTNFAPQKKKINKEIEIWE